MHLNSLQNLFYTVIILYIRQEYKILQKTFFHLEISAQNVHIKVFTRHLIFLSIWTMDNGHMGGCRSAPMFFRSKNSHFFRPLLSLNFQIIKPWAIRPHPTSAKRLTLPLKSSLITAFVSFRRLSKS